MRSIFSSSPLCLLWSPQKSVDVTKHHSLLGHPINRRCEAYRHKAQLKDLMRSPSLTHSLSREPANFIIAVVGGSEIH